MNPVVHFELPYENAERASAFYRAAFGWQTQPYGYVSFLDTERNRNSLLQARREATP